MNNDESRHFPIRFVQLFDAEHGLPVLIDVDKITGIEPITAIFLPGGYRWKVKAGGDTFAVRAFNIDEIVQTIQEARMKPNQTPEG